MKEKTEQDFKIKVLQIIHYKQFECTYDYNINVMKFVIHQFFIKIEQSIHVHIFLKERNYQKYFMPKYAKTAVTFHANHIHFSMIAAKRILWI